MSTLRRPQYTPNPLGWNGNHPNTQGLLPCMNLRSAKPSRTTAFEELDEGGQAVVFKACGNDLLGGFWKAITEAKEAARRRGEV